MRGRARVSAAMLGAVLALLAFGVVGSAADSGAPVDVTPPSVVASAGDAGYIALGILTGTWSGATSFSEAWEQCDALGGSCTPIPGANGPTYTTVAADLGHVIQIDLTGANGNGSTTVSAQTPYAIGPPTNASSPLLLGNTAAAGDALEVIDGTWNEGPSLGDQWQRCDGAGAGCADIAGATGSTYTTQSADLGHVLQAVVTATNAYGTATASAQTSEPIGAPTPLSLEPEIDGDFSAAGRLLTVSDGDWTGSPTSFAYQWERCDSSGAGCTDIGGATGNTYTTQSADLGHELSAVVTATNAYGSASRDAILPTSPIGAPEVFGHAPALGGDATAVGNVLTVSDGDWSGSPTSFSYEWDRCDADGINCAPIDGATANTYTIVDGDLGHILSVLVTAANANGTGTSAARTTFPAGYPQLDGGLQAAPQISGDASLAGDVLTVSDGTWFGTPTITYQWRLCDANGVACAAIADATANTYTIQSGDLGQVVEATVTATNSVGSSSWTPAQFLGLPANVSPPQIAGDATAAGNVLTVSDGTWEGSPTFAYQWAQCDGNGNDCTAIGGETANTYTVQLADAGHVLEAVVTATNAYGSTTASAQVHTTHNPPQIDGSGDPELIGDTSAAGNLFIVSTGAWTNSPTSFAFRWERCNDAAGNVCSDIPGATDDTYTTQAADLGFYLEAVVTASNGDGSTDAGSSVVGPIGAPAIAGFDFPQIAGDASAAGNDLTVSTGTWSGSPTFTYQWQQCDANGDNCTDIPGATDDTYTIQAGDLGHRLDAEVTGTNAYGVTTVGTLTESIGAPAIAGFDFPQISGDTSAAGNLLTIGTGTWSGSPTFTYQWQQCDANADNCTDIPGATGDTYTIQAGDLGHRLHAEITGTNAYGVTTVDTFTAAIGAPALAGSFPDITGDTSAAGNDLTVSTGTWSGSPTFTYQWQQCDANDANCTDIPGATGDTYTIQAGDLGHVLDATVTATNADGQGSVTVSTNTPVGLPQIVGFDFPEISGDTSAVGNDLTVSAGTWSGSPTITYQWERCDASGDNCADIPGATSNVYTLQTADLGHIVDANVTATGAAGPTTVEAATFTPVGAPGIVDFDFPQVTGDTSAVGNVLTVSNGTWSGSPTLTYQWSRCDADGFNCAAIDGATAQTYTIQADDLGHALQAAVTAANANGATTETDTTNAIGAPEISGGDFPRISGDETAAGNVLTVSTGTWTGSPTFTYEWDRCNAEGFDCTPIDGATSSSYTTQAADLGHVLESIVTAANATGSGFADAWTGFAIGAPEELGPFVDLTTHTGGVGDVLAVSHGAWSGSPTFTYEWLRCDANDENCVDIGGTTSNTYTIQSADVGHVIDVVVTATNANGSSFDEDETSIIGAPELVGADPAITGDPTAVGNRIAVSNGTWAGAASFSYQWARCDVDDDCVDIAGATSNTYTIQSVDMGQVLDVTVTATNANGSSFADATVLVGSPFDVVLPKISGDVSAPGKVLTVTNGTWLGRPTFTRQWYRCDSTGFTCAAIGGATGSSYTLVTADAGHVLYVAVTASNANGSTEADTADTALVGTGATQHLLSVSVAGGGLVTSSPDGIYCGDSCSAEFNTGATVVLTPHPASGTTFTGWSGGGCSGTGGCSIAIAADTTVTATFATTPSAPTITSFTPTSAGARATVTVTGTNLTYTKSVKLSGEAVPFTVVSATSVTFTVPADATSGSITITTSSGTATGAGTFTVADPPTIVSIGPGTGPVGTVVTITGTNLAHVVGVQIGHIVVVPTSVSDTTVTFVIPAGAVTGTITVLSPAGSATSAATFTVT